MKVELIRYTPEPEKVIAAAAKLCYSKTGVDGILDDLDDKKTKKFLNILMDLGHESPIEHVYFTFGVEGVSRVLTHQLVRHRIGCSYSQQSQRYVKLEQFEYVIPPQIKENKEAKDIFIKAMEEDQRHYDEIVEILYANNLNRLLSEGKSDKLAKQTAEKTSIEDARYVFPNACETKIVFTMSARALHHFFRLRACERAQWEIRDLATEMIRQVKSVAPILFKNAGPECIIGECPEGTMSCGKMNQIREKFNNL
ncbi:MAG: FAD-dependent thymidylate synthase [Firmicutes bacterium]|nr:FAD-dependent thymidylate synthase [Bacillota bacterium]